MGTMSLMDVGRFTVEDLHAYREQRQDPTVQLIEGELVVSPSPGWIHQVVHSQLFEVLTRAAPRSVRVISAPMDLRAGARSVLQPDLMVIDRSLTFDSEVTIPPLLVIEILSPSSQRTDLMLKPQTLARFGCEHYWVVDPLCPAIRAFRLADGAYVASETVEKQELFSTDVPFSLSFRPADLVS